MSMRAGWFRSGDAGGPARMGAHSAAAAVGSALLVLAAGAVYVNEGRAVATAQRLAQGAPVMRTVNAQSVNPDNDGKLVHLIGAAKPLVAVSDNRLNVQVAALGIRRTVEMYQWHERLQGGAGGEGATASYDQGWSERPESSAGFKTPAGHENPGMMAVDSHTFYADQVRGGGFRVPRDMIAGLAEFSPLALPPSSLSRLPSDLRGRARLDSGRLYFGRDPEHPEVGDLRVTLEQIVPQTVSVIARQAGAGLEPYRVGRKGSIAMLLAGEHPADAMMPGARELNPWTLWAVRAGGLLLMVLSARMSARWVVSRARGSASWSALADLGPRGIVALASGWGWLSAIGARWALFRPWFAAGLIVCGAGAVWLAVAHARQKRISVLEGGLMPEPEERADVGALWLRDAA